MSGYYLSGSGVSTQTVLWLCHVCRWTGVLPVGQPHVCKPASPSGGGPSL